MYHTIMWAYYIERMKAKELENIKKIIIDDKDSKKDKKLIRNESWDTFVKVHIPWML